jgi:CRP-like cAMP-binding protein
MSLSNTNKIYLVKESIFKLANFSSEEWEFYQSIIDEVSFKKKEFLTKRGEVENEAPTEQDKEICVDLGFQGNLVSSFASCLAQRPSAISIQAVTNIKAFRLKYLPVFDLLETSKNAERFHRLIAEQLYIRETRRTYTLISKSAEERYLHLLENQPDALRLIPIKDLASYLGIHPDSLSRIRNTIKG